MKKTSTKAKKKPRKRVKTSSRPVTRSYDPREWDDDATVEVNPEPRIRSEISTSIRLPIAMVNQLRKIAARKCDIGFQTLIKIWIAERLEKEMRRRASRARL
jgi:hypothetical protein